jgi:N-carbamoyl-L-amino-acid hydrolase
LLDAAVLATLDAACQALDAPATRLTSGAFHDAMYLAGHCPSAMLFVPSIGGISHNPVEATHRITSCWAPRARPV